MDELLTIIKGFSSRDFDEILPYFFHGIKTPDDMRKAYEYVKAHENSESWLSSFFREWKSQMGREDSNNGNSMCQGKDAINVDVIGDQLVDLMMNSSNSTDEKKYRFHFVRISKRQKIRMVQTGNG